MLIPGMPARNATRWRCSRGAAKITRLAAMRTARGRSAFPTFTPRWAADLMTSNHQPDQPDAMEAPLPRRPAALEPGLAPDADALDRHAGRRQRFLERIGAGVAVLPAARLQFKSRDTELRFRQDSDFFYLTGFLEPEAVAVLTPHDAERSFTLFVPPSDADREVWDGRREGVEGAIQKFRADAAYPIEQLGEHLRDLLEPADRIFYALGTDRELDRRLTELLVGFRRSRQRTGRGPVALADPGSVLGAMRLVKDEDELARMRRAAAITAAGHRAAMAAARPGIGEWELEAALESAWRFRGANGPAYPSIVASGPNATTLHYVSNDRRALDGELVLIDAGAEAGMYCGDITRTFPVSGRFSRAQRAVYELVLRAEEAALAAVRPDAPFSDIHQAALEVLVPGMIELGLLEGEPATLIEEGAYKRFYMHQTSHWLGLDVHDVGLYAEGGEATILRPGMVLTVEPGLYVGVAEDGAPAELRGIGVRIEDDVVVTEAGREILTRGVPVDPDEIETLVGRGGA
jgi:Xaa-Pro aminopeptidase